MFVLNFTKSNLMNLSNKRILMVIHQGALGGAERQALGLSKYLTEQRNCKVDLLLTYSNETTNEFDRYAKDCSINNIYHFGSPYLLCKREFSYRNLKRLVWSIKYLLKLRKGLMPSMPDVIIPFLNFPSKVSYFLYKLMPSVKFTFWHQLGLDSINMDVFEYIAVNNVPCVIGNASNCLDMFKSPYRVNPKKLHVLPQYLSLTKEAGNKNAVRNKFKIPENAIVMGMVAHYRPEKFHDLLLQAFILLTKNQDNIHLVFLGNRGNTDTTEKKYTDLLTIIENENLKDQVSLLSDIRVQDVLSILDIGVLVSRIEGVPNAVMEYMLYGLPVVATNHPGCISLLNDSPFLIDNKQDQLYDALEKLILSEELRISIGNINLEKIKKYDVASYVKKLEAIINKTLN
jgi:glycosyltransferase involved in cell wall biosynthesis